MKYSFVLSSLFVFLSFIAVSQNCNFSISVPHDITICDDGPVFLNGDIQGSYYSFEWSSTEGYSNKVNLKPSVFVSQTTNYKLKALSLPTTNLIVNGDFENGNTGFTTSYNYVADLPWSQLEM